MEVKYKQETKQKPTDSRSKVDELINKYNNNLGLRRNFESYWQSLHDYFYIESPDINQAYYPGTELNSNFLYDSTTLECADVLASGFMNYLTPSTSKWFRLRHKQQSLSADKEINSYFEDVSSEVYHTLNKSNFANQIIVSYKSSGVYGTACLLVEEDMEEDVLFYNLPIKQVVLIEDSRGRISEWYVEFQYTVIQAAERWGKEALSKEMNEELQNDKASTKTHKFLLHIAKRSMRDITRIDSKNLPFSATWIDFDGKHVVSEGGYHEMPAMVHRFDKRPFIAYGFSPAMKSLPFARMLNAIAKTNLRSMMKQTDPPIAIPHEAFIMPFNANPRAINYYEKGSIDNPKDIFPFGNYGNPQVGMVAIDYYAQKVKAMMYHDVFLAFQAITKDMNNPEIAERINEKMSMLGPAVGRYTGEVLAPIIIRTIGILARKGRLPQPPDALLQDPQYEIDYVSQLAQAQRRSELNTLVNALTMTGQMATFSPDVLDNIDPDKTVNEIWEITGASAKVLRDDKEIADIRESRMQAQAQAQQMAMMTEGAKVAESATNADLNMAKSRGSV